MVRIQYALDSWKTVRKDVAGAVRDFPADALTGTLVPGVDSLDTLARHILDAGHAFPGLLMTGIENMQTPDFRDKLGQFKYNLEPGASQEQLAEALEKAIEQRCEELARQPESFFSEEITRFDGTKLTRLEMLLFVKEHELVHRSQMFMLMRVKGLVPPTTKRRLAAAAAAKP